MVILARLVGIFIGVLGVIFLVMPDWMKRTMAFWKEGNRIYGGGVIRLAIAVVLLMAAPQARQPLTALILGILFLVSGIVIFMMGVEEGKKLIGWWEGQSTPVLRLMGIFVITFGALILSAI